jgi:hypothetical protein
LEPGTEKAYKIIRVYIDGLSILIGNCKVRMELFFKDLKIRLWIFFKKSSNFSQKAQPIFTFYKIITGLTGMLSLVMIFFCYNPGIFEVTHQPAVGKRSVPALKRKENKVFFEPIFSLSPKAKDLSAFF